jgi:hypothetical protein
MNELSDKRAQAALRERRAAIAGEITQPDRHLRHLREPIRRLDATLRLIDPNGDPKAIVGERLDKRVKPCGAGKLNRLILDALRRGERPMTTDEIVSSIVAGLGDGPDAAKGMTKSRQGQSGVSGAGCARGEAGRRRHDCRDRAGRSHAHHSRQLGPESHGGIRRRGLACAQTGDRLLTTRGRGAAGFRQADITRASGCNGRRPDLRRGRGRRVR